MREGEIRGVYWEDFDFETRTIIVHRNADRRGKKIGLPKTEAGERRIPMPDVVFEMLQQRASAPDSQMKRRAEWRIAEGMRLIEARASLEFGEWKRWLAENVDYTSECARTYMALARAAGAQSNVVELPRSIPMEKLTGPVFVTEREPCCVPTGPVVWRAFMELQMEAGIVGKQKRYDGAFGVMMEDRRDQTAQRVLPIVREIQESGITSPGMIAKELNARGVPTQLGRKWYRRSIIELLRYERGKYPKYPFHALRHFAASLFIEQGYSPKQLQQIMGHSSIQITYDRYGHLFPTPEDDRRRINAAAASIFATSRDTA
jgi:hypothetical protein